MCIHVCVCTWLHVWTYWYAHICVCIGVCVFPIFIWHFNPSSIFLYIIYIAHCAIILLCTLMLYICDRSTPDLNIDDELYLVSSFFLRNILCYILNSFHPSAAYMHRWTVSISSGTGLSPVWCLAITWTNADYYQLDTWEQFSVKFESEFYHFHY